MTYEEFLKFVQAKCTYETIYSDSDGRNILVIKLLDAYGMVNKAQRPWVGLTDEEIGVPTEPIQPHEAIMFARVIEALIKGKNT
jgi:hypothetical protein